MSRRNLDPKLVHEVLRVCLGAREPLSGSKMLLLSAVAVLSMADVYHQVGFTLPALYEV
jgi:hypothetical protein